MVSLDHCTLGSLGNRLWRKFVSEFSWDQHLWKEGKEADADGEGGLGAVSPEVSADLCRALKLGLPFSSVLIGAVGPVMCDSMPAGHWILAAPGGSV